MESEQVSQLNISEKLAELVDAGDWHFKENEFNDFISHKTDPFYNDKVELKFYGNVDFGNDRFGFTLEHKEEDNVYILSFHISPAEKYHSQVEKEQIFNFDFSSEKFEDPATYEQKKYQSSIFEDIRLEDIGKSSSELKAFICNYFTEKGLISPEHASKYKSIRDNGTNFFLQRQKALKEYFPTLLKQPKLSPKELSDLAVYYDNKVYKNLAATGEEDMVNAVKWMLQDGLKTTQIAIVGSAMISCDPLDPDLVKKVLKSPEIKEFQEELKAKNILSAKTK